MPGNLINRGQERGADTSYRAEVSLSHPTDCIMPVLRGFLRVRSGCARLVQSISFAFAPFGASAIRTLDGASS